MATILIVDDHAINREFLVTLLNYEKHTTVEAADGLQALQVARETTPDLIITDILMPVMNGCELVQNLHADYKLSSIPVIFYTATYRLEDAALLAMANNVKYVLSKPSEPQLILETVNKALEIIKPATDKLTPTSNLPSNSQLVTLMEFISNLASETDSKKLLKLFCNGSHKIIGAKYSILGILTARDKQLQNLYECEKNVKEMDVKIFPQKTDTLISRIITQKSPIIFDKIEPDTISKLLITSPIEKNLLALPIMTANNLYGFMYFGDKLDGAFKEIDIEIAKTTVAVLAMLYENIELYKVISMVSYV